MSSTETGQGQDRDASPDAIDRRVWEPILDAGRRLVEDPATQGASLRKAVHREVAAGRLGHRNIPSGPDRGTYVRRSHVTALIESRSRARRAS